MNTEKVFTAFNKVGEELLLFRKDNSSFINLITEEEYPKDKIDLTSLSLISNSIALRKYMLKNNIRNKYKKDREKLINTKNYLIGLKVVVTNYEKWYTGKGYDIYSFVNKTKINYDTTLDIYINLNKEDFLGYQENEEPEKIYDMQDFRNGKEYIIIKDSLNNLIKENYLPKKNINEIGYKLRKSLM